MENWASTEDQIQYWLSDYWVDPTGKFMVKEDIPPIKVYFSDFGLNRTELKLCLMGALALRYPFPERLLMEKGKFVGLLPIPTLVFSDMKDIEKWRLSVEKNLHSIMININWRGSEPFTQGFDWNHDINFWSKFWKKKELELDGYSPDILKQFRELPKEFCSNVESIYGIATTLGFKLKRLHYLGRVSPSNAIIIITLISAMVTFFSGVIIPIIHPTACKLFIVWIPAAFYSYFMIYLMIRVLAILRF